MLPDFIYKFFPILFAFFALQIGANEDYVDYPEAANFTLYVDENSNSQIDGHFLHYDPSDGRLTVNGHVGGITAPFFLPFRHEPLSYCPRQHLDYNGQYFAIQFCHIGPGACPNGMFFCYVGQLDPAYNDEIGGQFTLEKKEKNPCEKYYPNLTEWEGVKHGFWMKSEKNEKDGGVKFTLANLVNGKSIEVNLEENDSCFRLNFGSKNSLLATIEHSNGTKIAEDLGIDAKFWAQLSNGVSLSDASLAHSTLFLDFGANTILYWHKNFHAYLRERKFGVIAEGKCGIRAKFIGQNMVKCYNKMGGCTTWFDQRATVYPEKLTKIEDISRELPAEYKGKIEFCNEEVEGVTESTHTQCKVPTYSIKFLIWIPNAQEFRFSLGVEAEDEATLLFPPILHNCLKEMATNSTEANKEIKNEILLAYNSNPECFFRIGWLFHPSDSPNAKNGSSNFQLDLFGIAYFSNKKSIRIWDQQNSTTSDQIVVPLLTIRKNNMYTMDPETGEEVLLAHSNCIHSIKNRRPDAETPEVSSSLFIADFIIFPKSQINYDPKKPISIPSCAMNFFITDKQEMLLVDMGN